MTLCLSIVLNASNLQNLLITIEYHDIKIERLSYVEFLTLYYTKFVGRVVCLA